MSFKKKIPALKVKQWLSDWDKVEYDKKSFRKKPEEHFYTFSMSASTLKSLSGIQRRGGKVAGNSIDTGIQRAHEESRSKNISQYVKYGYPWSDLSPSQRNDKFKELRKPGWLPTAIVINILGPNDLRRGSKVSDQDIVKVEKADEDFSRIVLPDSYKKDLWKPQSLPPFEIIDGQHRLFAFDGSIDEDYELPVVAFHSLDVSWQAYLFWTINIKPKRINPSLAFDLYPLLRTEEWLDKFEGHKVYKEARSQELVESLWAYSKSPWYQRINMLGDSSSTANVTQAAWIRALLKTYVKSFSGRGVKIGGLYGAPVGEDKIVLPWNKAQQAAFLILIWSELENSVKSTKAAWAKSLREEKIKKDVKGDVAFNGPHTLLNNDQGITAVLNVTNDIFYLMVDKLEMLDWDMTDVGADIETAHKELMKKKNIVTFTK